jgi:hypothetical protein
MGEGPKKLMTHFAFRFSFFDRNTYLRMCFFLKQPLIPATTFSAFCPLGESPIHLLFITPKATKLDWPVIKRRSNHLLPFALAAWHALKIKK